MHPWAQNELELITDGQDGGNLGPAGATVHPERDQQHAEAGTGHPQCAGRAAYQELLSSSTNTSHPLGDMGDSGLRDPGGRQTIPWRA